MDDLSLIWRAVRFCDKEVVDSERLYEAVRFCVMEDLRVKMNVYWECCGGHTGEEWTVGQKTYYLDTYQGRVYSIFRADEVSNVRYNIKE